MFLCLALVVSVHGAETNDLNRLKPNQVVSPGPPPKAPTQFDPDPNVLVLPTNVPPATNWSRRVLIASNAPPQVPAQFNPDPGASLKAAPTNVVSPLFPGDVVLPPAFSPPPVPAEQALPRPEVRRGVGSPGTELEFAL